MEKALTKQLAKKQKALALNMAALKAGFDYAQSTFEKRDSDCRQAPSNRRGAATRVGRTLAERLRRGDGGPDAQLGESEGLVTQASADRDDPVDRHGPEGRRRTLFRDRGRTARRRSRCVPPLRTSIGSGGAAAADGDEGALAALAYGSTTREEVWTPAVVERLRLVAGVMGQAFARQASDTALQMHSPRSAGCAIASRPTTWSFAAR